MNVSAINRSSYQFNPAKSNDLLLFRDKIGNVINLAIKTA